MRKLSLLVALSAAFSSAALADFSGRVIKVHDGDTLTLAVDRKSIRVRLDGVDAPELGQPFGNSSRNALIKLCAGRDATVVDRGKDPDGWIIGGVICGGIDANGEQVRVGMAWASGRYLPLGSPLYELETNARLRGLGLWRDPDPLPPWEWRKRAQPTALGRTR
jgi:micrococcal nuclease